MNDLVSPRNWPLSLFSKTHLGGYQYFPGEPFSLLRDDYGGDDYDGGNDVNDVDGGSEIYL